MVCLGRGAWTGCNSKQERSRIESRFLVVLISCQYCHKIHPDDYDCGMRPKRKRQASTEQKRFRDTQAWRKKSAEIRVRDSYLCQCCLRNFPGTDRQYNSVGVGVHHNIPLVENRDLALDNSNLISLCSVHHEMAESGRIGREQIRRIIEEQERQSTPGGI